jgi:cysteine-rich repeat protein
MGCREQLGWNLDRIRRGPGAWVVACLAVSCASTPSEPSPDPQSAAGGASGAAGTTHGTIEPAPGGPLGIGDFAVKSAGGASASGGSANGGGAGTAAPPAGSGGGPPLTSVSCGDGIRDTTVQTQEECDDGPGAGADLCTELCQVSDAVAVRGPAAGRSRYLGEGRHPAAAGLYGFGVVFVEPDPEPPVIGLSVFDAAGDPRARFDVSGGSSPVLFASPTVAALEDGGYAVAWTDHGGDGDGLGVALRRVTPNSVNGALPPESGFEGSVTLSPLQFATGKEAFSQYDADLLRVGDQLIIAWTDASDANTGPDIRYRVFDAAGSGANRFLALDEERSLSNSVAFEGNVALAPFGSTWAAAFRSAGSAEETIEVVVPGEDLVWSIGPHLPGAPEDRPALAELDENHLLVLFSVGTDPENTGIGNVFRLRAAVLARSASAPLAELDLPPLDPAYQALTVSQSHPSLVRAGDVLFAAYRTASLVADPNAEDVFSQVLAWEDNALSPIVENPIPRFPDGSLGDQRFPALAVGPRQIGTSGLPEPAPLGALVIAWDDYGATVEATQGQPDVLVQHWPLPVVRVDEPDPGECGDGVVQAPRGETCDDGNTTNTDACPSTCLVATCGDGFVRAGVEECDPGPPPGNPGCNSDCTLPSCGYLPGDQACATGEYCDDDGQCRTSPCNSTDPFISLTSVFADTVRASGIAFSADKLTAYVSVGPSPGYDIKVATRATPTSPFGSFSAVAGIPTPGDEQDPWLSKDGLELYYSTTNTANGDPDLLRVTRSTPTGTFGGLTSLSVNQPYFDQDPYFAPGQTTFFFASERSSAGVELWSSTYDNGTFAAPVVLANVNQTNVEDSEPVLTRDGLRLYFKSRRSAVSHPNVSADGDGDIYMATRSSTSASFGTPVLQNILNTTGIDFPVAISPDGCSLFVASNRHVGLSDNEIYRIYEAKRGTPPPNVTITMKVFGNAGDSVGAPFNCPAGGTCTVTQAYGTYVNPIFSSRNAYWSGGCEARGSPGLSSDGVVVFGVDPVCTVQFP